MQFFGVGVFPYVHNDFSAIVVGVILSIFFILLIVKII